VTAVVREEHVKEVTVLAVPSSHQVVVVLVGMVLLGGKVLGH
jgi:hypothetical protein